MEKGFFIYRKKLYKFFAFMEGYIIMIFFM